MLLQPPRGAKRLGDALVTQGIVGPALEAALAVPIGRAVPKTEESTRWYVFEAHVLPLRVNVVTSGLWPLIDFIDDPARLSRSETKRRSVAIMEPLAAQRR